MILIYAPAPRPDATYWPGRCGLAALDALAWPVGFFIALIRLQPHTGIVGPVLGACLVLVALRRLYVAVWANHRYRFTTWRWGRVVLGLLIIGWVIKLLLAT